MNVVRKVVLMKHFPVEVVGLGYQLALVLVGAIAAVPAVVGVRFKFRGYERLCISQPCLYFFPVLEGRYGVEEVCVSAQESADVLDAAADEQELFFVEGYCVLSHNLFLPLNLDGGDGQSCIISFIIAGVLLGIKYSLAVVIIILILDDIYPPLVLFGEHH